jgi:hypothetical protein
MALAGASLRARRAGYMAIGPTPNPAATIPSAITEVKSTCRMDVEIRKDPIPSTAQTTETSKPQRRNQLGLGPSAMSASAANRLISFGGPEAASAEGCTDSGWATVSGLVAVRLG